MFSLKSSSDWINPADTTHKFIPSLHQRLPLLGRFSRLLFTNSNNISSMEISGSEHGCTVPYKTTVGTSPYIYICIYIYGHSPLHSPQNICLSHGRYLDEIALDPTFHPQNTIFRISLLRVAIPGRHHKVHKVVPVFVSQVSPNKSNNQGLWGLHLELMGIKNYSPH